MSAEGLNPQVSQRTLAGRTPSTLERLFIPEKKRKNKKKENQEKRRETRKTKTKPLEQIK